MAQPTQLFLDTNILLSFYHFSKDDLEELQKLVVLLQQHTVELLVPEQVKQEFERNREKVIADSLKMFNGQSFTFTFPQICRTYLEHEELQRHLKADVVPDIDL